MNYNFRQAIGNSGEYLLGYLFTHKLKWIYRLSTIDIGIDAEIEIVDKDISTGSIIKLQVKSSCSDDFNKKKIIYQIEKAHIDYWKQLSIPVLLCKVFIKSQKVYVLPIDDNIVFSDSKSLGKVNVDFNNSIKMSDDDFVDNINAFFNKFGKTSKKQTDNLLTMIKSRVKKLPVAYTDYLLTDIDYLLAEIDEILDDIHSFINTLKTLNLYGSYTNIEDITNGFYRQLNHLKNKLIEGSMA